ncbi:MAG: hypothetical protein F4W90_05865 [Gammaproteobacteria bacterium]|nr:hypothetical protein [Gammaproteobacteria bacterium]
MRDSHEEGLREQLARQANSERGGWKVGLTSGASRNAMGKGFRPFGHIARNRIFDSGATIRLSDVNSIGVENELCFQFAETVPMDADRAGLIGCIAAVKPAFELNQGRLSPDATDRDRLADNLSQYGIVVGKGQELSMLAELPSLDVALFRDETLEAKVASEGHIDDHFDSLLALVQSLAHFRLQIESGDHVITGAYGRATVTDPAVWRGEFSLDIGSVAVKFE